MRIVKNTIGVCLCIMLPLTSAMAGTTMLSKSVKNGERFDISLRSNPSTGYTWMLRTLPAQLMLVSARYSQSANCKAGVTGCGGDQVFSFKGVSTGTGKIELVYGRSWEADTAKTEVMTVTVG
ncbi:proteinase IV [Enterobacteriaceae bacterium ML5]|nr:proteinase IV [Enterobacteriaceae bacterium ML5]